jgi:hypothetical protein
MECEKWARVAPNNKVSVLATPAHKGMASMTLQKAPATVGGRYRCGDQSS